MTWEDLAPAIATTVSPPELNELVGRHGEDLRLAAGKLLAGQVTPFLGAGINSVPGWADDSMRPPSADELARQLFEEAHKPPNEPQTDLARVSQYIDVMLGWENLYEMLRDVFGREHQSTLLHRFLAALPRVLRRAGAPQQLIVTTNYDDLLESAFEEAGEPYDLVAYSAHPAAPDRGLFRHTNHEGDTVVIPEGTANRAVVDLDARPTILKIHGTVDRMRRRPAGDDVDPVNGDVAPLEAAAPELDADAADPCNDGFVISEDHYIDFLAGRRLAKLLPVDVLARLRGSDTLFLAYRLRDWNLRVFFRRLWEGEGRWHHRARWAVQREPATVDKRYWQRRGVSIVDADLRIYLAGLTAEITGMLAATAAPAELKPVG